MDIEGALRSEIGGYEKSSWTGEIGGMEVTLHATPITARDVERVRRKFGEAITTPAAMAEMISIKATDEHGKQVFGPKLRPLLDRLRTTVIGGMFEGLFGDQLEEETDEGFEDRVGNSGATATD